MTVSHGLTCDRNTPPGLRWLAEQQKIAESGQAMPMFEQVSADGPAG